MAPEIHLRKPYSGTSVDLFAAGIILFIMISGSPPFAKADPRTDPHYKLICANKFDVFWKAHERNKPKQPGQESFYNNEFKDFINGMLALEPSARPTVEQIKNHPWFNGPIIEANNLKMEFQQRKKMVDAALQKQREAKQKEKLMAKMQTHHAQGAFTGIRPFRSLETEMEGYIEKELSKIDFKTKRELQDYQPIAGFKCYTEVFSVMSPDFLFKLLCENSESLLSNYTVSEDSYKIKGKSAQDEGSCAINITLSKVDDSTTCIEFQRKNGDIMTFYKVVEDFKKKLPDLEVVEDKEEKTETQ